MDDTPIIETSIENLSLETKQARLLKAVIKYSS